MEGAKEEQGREKKLGDMPNQHRTKRNRRKYQLVDVQCGSTYICEGTMNKHYRENSSN